MHFIIDNIKFVAEPGQPIMIENPRNLRLRRLKVGNNWYGNAPGDIFNRMIEVILNERDHENIDNMPEGNDRYAVFNEPMSANFVKEAERWMEDGCRKSLPVQVYDDQKAAAVLRDYLTFPDDPRTMENIIVQFEAAMKELKLWHWLANSHRSIECTQRSGGQFYTWSIKGHSEFGHCDVTEAFDQNDAPFAALEKAYDRYKQAQGTRRALT